MDMQYYHRIEIATLARLSGPAPVPDLVRGLADSDLVDLSFLPAEHGLSGVGFWPEMPVDPDFDPATETLDLPIAYTVDPAARVVRATRTARSLTGEEMAPRREMRKAEVMVKRDAMVDGGFSFNGTVFQTAATDRENISGASQLAFMAMVAGGALPGDLHWHGGVEAFGWIAFDNTVVPMDAPTVIEFGKAVAAFKQACIFYARYLKDEIDAADDPMGVDINSGWPA